MKMTLTFLGRDDWDRPVYEDDDGRLYVDIAPCSCYPHIHTKSGNGFEGEPEMPVEAEITFMPYREKW